MGIKQAFLAAEILKPAGEREGRVRDVVFYSGAKVERWDFWKGERYWLTFSTKPEDVNLDRLNNGAPLLNAHSRYSVADQLGVIESAWLKGKKGMATVRFSERPEVDGVWQDVEAGIIRNLSMGVTINQLRETTPKGAKEKEYLAIDWEPQEISVVPVASDAGSQFLAGIPLTEELLTDASALWILTQAAFASEFGFVLDKGQQKFDFIDPNTKSNNLAPPGQQAEKDEAAENLRQLIGKSELESALTKNHIGRTV